MRPYVDLEIDSSFADSYKITCCCIFNYLWSIVHLTLCIAVQKEKEK